MPADQAIAEIAARQHGNISRCQLLGLGVGSSAIAYRLKLGRLYRVFTGVYAVGHPATTALERAAAAVLACGPGAVLSHGSAGVLWGVLKVWRPPFEVTARSGHGRRGIRVHRSVALIRHDKRTHLGVRVTSPARTVLDLAPRLEDRALARTINDLRIARRLSVDDLAELLERCQRHPGASRVRPFVDASTGPTRSVFEDAFVAFAERFELPRPQCNVHVAGHEVDAVFAAERVIVELDGFEFHRDRSAFEGDRDRDADTLAAGFVTVRITWERLSESARHEARRLHAILEQRRA